MPEDDPKPNSPADVGYTEGGRHDEFIVMMLKELTKKVKRWADEVVVPEVIIVDDRVRFMFENANKKHLSTVDELIRLSCLDLAKKKIDKPLETFASSAFRYGLRHETNRAMELVVVRAIKSASLQREYRDEDTDQFRKKELYGDLLARGLIKKATK